MKACFLLFACFAIIAAGMYAKSSGKILSPDEKLNRKNPVMPNTVIVRFKSESYNNSSYIRTLPAVGAVISEPLLPKNISVDYRIENKQEQTLSRQRVEQIRNAEEPLLRTFFIEYKGSLPPEKYCQYLLKENPAVEIAEPVVADKVLGMTNDPLASQQKMLEKIKAFEAWDICPGDTNVVIGISDIGVWQDHEDIKNSIAPNWLEIPDNGIDDDNNGYVDDFIGYNFAYKDDGTKPGNTLHEYEHGTYVAGISGATWNNNRGIAGVAGKCRIFPLKCGILMDSSVHYSYQSIIYAAVRGFKVLNCSWGSAKPPGIIDQSIIDYAVGRDVAIVAAGGDWDYDMYEQWYPAGYFGVLGVGEVDQEDATTCPMPGGSAMGSQIGINAPGIGNIGTINNSPYYEPHDQYGGTSWSAPVVSGVVAVVRAKYPELSAIQALEFTRQCTDSVTNKNPVWKDVIKGRINMLKAVQTDPFSIPSIKVKSYNISKTSGTESDRFTAGDEGELKIQAHNYLGAAKNLKFVTSMAADETGTVQVTDGEVDISSISRDEDLNIETFKFRVNEINSSKVFFRVDIYGENNYHDFFLLPFTPFPQAAFFANETISFSAGDRGTFGYAGINRKEGTGFTYKFNTDLFYRGGLIITENNSKVLSSLFGSVSERSDFSVTKPFAEPDKYTGIINDSEAIDERKIGLQIQQNFYIPDGDTPYTKINITLKNTSGHVLNDVAAGYYFDWDIGYNNDSNKVYLFEEAVSVSGHIQGAAEIAEYTSGDFPYVACAAVSKEGSAEAQAAGVDTVYTNSLNFDEHIALINSGTTLQYSGVNDIGMAVGMKFKGEFKPDETRTFDIVIGVGEDKIELAEGIKKFITDNIVSAESMPEKDDATISPVPANDFIDIRFKADPGNLSRVSIRNIFGEDVLDPIQINETDGNEQVRMNISGLNPGMYFIRIKTGQKEVIRKVAIIR